MRSLRILVLAGVVAAFIVFAYNRAVTVPNAKAEAIRVMLEVTLNAVRVHEEAFFSEYDRFSDDVAELGLRLPDSVAITLSTPSTSTFRAEARHPSARHECVLAVEHGVFAPREIVCSPIGG